MIILTSEGKALQQNRIELCDDWLHYKDVCSLSNASFPMKPCLFSNQYNCLWQSIRPADLSLGGLTFWPNWLERWLATLSMPSSQVRMPVGLSVLGRYIWGSSTDLGKAQHVDNSLRANWLSCFWPGENGGLSDRDVWCHWGREECDLLASRSGSDPLAELVRALACDLEYAFNPGSNTIGVVGAGTLQLHKHTWTLVMNICFTGSPLVYAIALSLSDVKPSVEAMVN